MSGTIKCPKGLEPDTGLKPQNNVWANCRLCHPEISKVLKNNFSSNTTSKKPKISLIAKLAKCFYSICHKVVCLWEKWKHSRQQTFAYIQGTQHVSISYNRQAPLPEILLLSQLTKKQEFAQNLQTFFDSFLIIYTSRAKGIVCFVYQLFRLNLLNYLSCPQNSLC